MVAGRVWFVELAGACARIDALASMDALACEPTLTQAQLVRPEVAAVLALPVGPLLALGVDALVPLSLSEKENAQVLIAAGKVRGFMQAVEITVLADWQRQRTARVDREVLAGHPDRWGARGGSSSIGAEMAPHWAVAPGTATHRVATSCYAEEHLPVAVDTLADGGMTAGQLDVLVDVARSQPDGVREKLEARAVSTAPRLTSTQLRHDLTGLAARLDPAAHADAKAKGVKERDVWLGPSKKAECSRLGADLPSAGAHAMMLALAVRAAKAAGDERLAGQLRADALSEASLG